MPSTAGTKAFPSGSVVGVDQGPINWMQGRCKRWGHSAVASENRKLPSSTRCEGMIVSTFTHPSTRGIFQRSLPVL